MHGRFLRLSAAFVLCLGLSVGCTAPENKIIGEWKVDITALKDDPNIQKLKGDAQKKLLEMAGKMFGALAFSFTEDGQFKVVSVDQGAVTVLREGTYSLKNVTGNTVTLETSLKRNGTDNLGMLTLVIDGNRLRMTGDKSREMILVKK